VPARFRIEDPALAQQLRQVEQLVRRVGGRRGWSAAACAISRSPATV